MNIIILIILWTVVIFLFICAVNTRLGRRFNRWLKRNTLGRLSEMARKYKGMKEVSKPADTLKLWASFIGLFIFIIFVAGLLSYLQFVDDARNACVRSGSQDGCEFDYNYFVPDGLRPLDKLNPSKLGIEMGCGCGDYENHIMIYEVFRRWLK